MYGFGFSFEGKAYRSNIQVYEEAIDTNEHVLIIPVCRCDVWSVLNNFYFMEVNGATIMRKCGIKHLSYMKRVLFRATGTASNFFATRVLCAIMGIREHIPTSMEKYEKYIPMVDSETIPEKVLNKIVSNSRMTMEYVIINTKYMRDRNLTFRALLRKELKEIKVVPEVFKRFMLSKKVCIHDPNPDEYRGRILKSKNLVVIDGVKYFTYYGKYLVGYYGHRDVFKSYLFAYSFVRVNFPVYRELYEKGFFNKIIRVMNKRRDVYFNIDIPFSCVYGILYAAVCKFCGKKLSIDEFIKKVKGFETSAWHNTSMSMIVRVSISTGLGYRRTYDYFRRIREDRTGESEIRREIIVLRVLLECEEFLLEKLRELWKLGYVIVSESFICELIKNKSILDLE